MPGKSTFVCTLSMNLPEHTAILLFSRTAESEANAKRLLPRSKRASTQLCQGLVAHTLAQCNATTLPVETHFDPQQRGNSFGERLANAIEAAFANGYQQLLVVGTDSPGLSAELLAQAAQNLSTHPLVLGPATDGGTWLIGLHQKHYSRSAFLALHWEQPSLQQSFADWAGKAGWAIAWLTALHDIDTTSDLKLAVQQLSSHHAVRLLLRSLSASQLSVRPKCTPALPARWRPAALGFRGPPASTCIPC